MNCSEIDALAPLYLSGELDPVRAAGFTAHLEGCRNCALEIERQTAVDARIRESVLAETTGSPGFEQRVMARIRERQRSRARWRLAAAAVAALLILGISGYFAVFMPRTHGLYAAAARDHRVEVVDRQPRRWRFDPSAIEELAARQGLASIQLSSLAPAGYRLKQGRLCRVGGRIFLHLVYMDGERNFSLFLRRPEQAGSGSGEIYSASFEAERVAGFEDMRVDAVIVTDQPGDAASRFAHLAAAVL